MIDVILPTYNNYEELKKCLIALSHQTVQEFDVWIAVDGSTDNTLLELPQFLSLLPYRTHILEHPDKQNHGRSATRNLALPYIKNKLLWLLDSDMIPESTCLKAHLNVFTQYKNAISVGAICYENVHTNIWARYVATRGHAKYKHLSLLPWNYFITANSLIPAEYFVFLNGFDEKIHKYGGEDMEFAYRMHLQYAPFFYKNDFAICKTTQHKTLFQALTQLEEYGREGLPYIYQKHTQMPKVYHLNNLHGNKFRRKIYEFLTLPVWSKCIKYIIPYLPFLIRKWCINYLVIAAIFKGYKSKIN